MKRKKAPPAGASGAVQREAHNPWQGRPLWASDAGRSRRIHIFTTHPLSHAP